MDSVLSRIKKKPTYLDTYFCNKYAHIVFACHASPRSQRVKVAISQNLATKQMHGAYGTTFGEGGICFLHKVKPFAMTLKSKSI